MQPEQEILTDGQISLILYGGVTAVLLIVGIFFLGVRWKTSRKIEKRTIVKELYNEKERKNGQHKGGARGSF